MIRLRIFRRLYALCLPLAALLFLTQCVMPAAAVAESSKVKVQAGTPIDLVFDLGISGETAVPGQQVVLKVANAVVVDGKTVIAAGAAALGEIVSAKKSGMVGSPGAIAVSVISVKAVDGTVISLSGSKAADGKSNVTTSIVVTVVCCILGLLMRGGNADIPSGSTLRATVATPVEVLVP